MAEQNPKTPPGPKVSPTRTIVSLVLLLVVGVVCLVELRAGFGQMMTGKAMAAKSEDGVFSELTTLEDAKKMLALAPSESVERDDPTEIVYRYEWFSLLRPLMGETSPQLFLVTRKGDTPVAVAFHTSAEDDPAAGSGSDPNALAEPRMTPPGGPTMMPGGMGGMRPPDGIPPGAKGGPSGQRPAAEGDESTAPETPAEAPSTDPAADSPVESPTPPKDDESPSKPESETPPN